MHFPCHVLFGTNHKSIDPTSSHRCAPRYKNTDTFCTFYLNCFRLDCSMLSPIGCCLDLSHYSCWLPWNPGINSAEERHVSTSWIRNFITFLVCFFIMQMLAREETPLHPSTWWWFVGYTTTSFYLLKASPALCYFFTDLCIVVHY